MELNIKYFGMLAELTNCKEEELSFGKTTIHDLLETLYDKYPDLKNKKFRVAQNLMFVSGDSKLSAGEIVLLPPSAGG